MELRQFFSRSTGEDLMVVESLSIPSFSRLGKEIEEVRAGKRDIPPASTCAHVLGKPIYHGQQQLSFQAIYQEKRRNDPRNVLDLKRRVELQDCRSATRRSQEITPDHKREVKMTWEGEIKQENWCDFYDQILLSMKSSEIRKRVEIEVLLNGEMPSEHLDEARIHLHNIGLHDDIKAE
jgi:hypothetical protein